jgi:hypothetical protein
MRVVLILALLAAPAAAQTLYRCDVDGKPVYQQVPCPGGRVIATPPPLTAADDWRGQVALAIVRREVMIGMTAAEVTRAWGPPDRINRTVTGGSTTEQWVYRRKRTDAQLLYLDDGVLRSAQTSE